MNIFIVLVPNFCRFAPTQIYSAIALFVNDSESMFDSQTSRHVFCFVSASYYCRWQSPDDFPIRRFSPLHHVCHCYEKISFSKYYKDIPLYWVFGSESQTVYFQCVIYHDDNSMTKVGKKKDQRLAYFSSCVGFVQVNWIACRICLRAVSVTFILEWLDLSCKTQKMKPTIIDNTDLDLDSTLAYRYFLFLIWVAYFFALLNLFRS